MVIVILAQNMLAIMVQGYVLAKHFQDIRS